MSGHQSTAIPSRNPAFGDWFPGFKQVNQFATEFEQKNQARVADIKRDFPSGNKKERVRNLGKDDCR